MKYLWCILRNMVVRSLQMTNLWGFGIGLQLLEELLLMKMLIDLVQPLLGKKVPIQAGHNLLNFAKDLP